MYLLKVFSSKKKKEEDKEVSNHTKSGRKGAALAAAGIGGWNISHDSFIKATSNQKEDKEAAKAIIKEAKKDNPGLRFKKRSNSSGSSYNPKKNIIKSPYNPAVLAHEAGHGHYYAGKGKGIGKLAHKLYPGPLGTIAASQFGGIAYGVNSGIQAARYEAKGKKQSKLERHLPWAAPVAVSAPMLVAEGMASRHGLKLMKKVGIDKKVRDEGRKTLAKAWGTYGTAVALNAGLGEASRGISYRVSKPIINWRKNKKKNED